MENQTVTAVSEFLGPVSGVPPFASAPLPNFSKWEKSNKEKKVFPKTPESHLKKVDPINAVGRG